MEIQATPLAVASTGSTSTGTASGSASPGAFTAALSGVLAVDGQAAGGGKAAGNGLSALIQWLSPLLAQAGMTEEQVAGIQAEQLDGLIALLEQADAAGQSDVLLEQPELQSWLQELQALLLQLTAGQAGSEGGETSSPDQRPASIEDEEPDDSLALNPLLFVPLQPAVSTAEGEAADGPAKKVGAINVQEALNMLKQLKDLVAAGSKDPAVQHVSKELSAVLQHAAAQLGEASAAKKEQTQAPQQLLMTKAGSDAGKTAADAPLLHTAPHAMHKLEAIALKHQALQMTIDTSVKDEGPLFEPLAGDRNDGEGQVPMTVNDWMKQNASGQQAARAAVLQMPASTFSDEMTKFVVSSFVLGKTEGGMTEARISLYPQHLGHVEVKLTLHNGQLIAQFMADSLTGKEMLESQLSQLRTSLQAQGIQVDKLEVTQSQSYQSGMFQEGRQQQSQSSKQQKSGGKELSADDVKAEEEALASRLRQAGNDGSIDYTV
ncbi:flagellar hook-length control protein FliK [Paenibacillus sp. UNCCL117]|uniref:flagellar hook-length control protein FliK n=1 Tax=unclassified Paenibacillus TaxID=185978 RepID=UPI00088E01E2|nr:MULTISPECIES: flagellar hook-length control protein FliK [unclassified Paenibacillus]SDC86265.1 flagellar hook-length control protein FliK [Paenibacillus sp. cl123]SFW27766.1 flagellar hook-length control protein FliK [Paenibacillus sp. UNCCL117]